MKRSEINKALKELEKAKEMNQKIARNYLMYSKWYDEDNQQEG